MPGRSPNEKKSPREERKQSLSPAGVSSRPDDEQGQVQHISAVSEESDSLAEMPTSEQDEHSTPQSEVQNSEETQTDNEQPSNSKPIKLYKSSRLKSYITLTFASFINYDAVVGSSTVIGSAGVPSTSDQQSYAFAVSLVSLVLSGAAVVMHLDCITPLERVWISAFRPKSRIELALAGFLVIWWSVGTGVQTSVNGIAGDAKGQYSFYFSAWVCVITSYGLLDLWLIAANMSGIKAFIASWPNRSPAWLCILFLSIFTMIWYLDLWQNSDDLNREEERFIREYFEGVRDGHWALVVTVIAFTLFAAAIFVLIELFRETKVDGSSQPKGYAENVIEGICFFSLVLAWIPTVLIATTPGGPASLVGNAYFFTWLLVIFVFEGLFWYIHDVRRDLHRALKEKDEEYRMRQKRILEETKRIQREARDRELSHDKKVGAEPRRDRASTEYFDAIANS